jgi:hypothetical protein
MYQLHTPRCAAIAHPGLGGGLGIVAVDTQRLRVALDIEPTSPQGHDVIAYGGDLDVTPCTERLRPGELVAQLLQATTRRA